MKKKAINLTKKDIPEIPMKERIKTPYAEFDMGQVVGGLRFGANDTYVEGDISVKDNIKKVGMALDDAGNIITDIINDRINTSTKKILSDFTFGSDDYVGSFKAGDITWNPETGVITGGSGILINKGGIIQAENGVAKATLPISGSPTFDGILAATGVVTGTINATSGKFGTTNNYWSVGSKGLTAVASDGDVIINYGKTDFGQDSTAGFILGYDYSASKSKFEIGSSASKIFKYDGTDISLIGGTITGGVIQTAASGGRIKMSGGIDDKTNLRWYNSDTRLIEFEPSDIDDRYQTLRLSLWDTVAPDAKRLYFSLDSSLRINFYSNSPGELGTELYKWKNVCISDYPSEDYHAATKDYVDEHILNYVEIKPYAFSCPVAANWGAVALADHLPDSAKFIELHLGGSSGVTVGARTGNSDYGRTCQYSATVTVALYGAGQTIEVYGPSTGVDYFEIWGYWE